MKTFEDFLNDKGFENKLIETATLMAEKDIDPVAFLQEWYGKNDPEIAAILDEAFWDDLKSAGSTMWQGVKQGAKEFAANQWGPQSKFNNAIQALTSLANYMGSDPQLRKLSGSRTGRPLVDQIGNINRALATLRDYIPQMQSQVSGRWTQPNAPQQQQQPQQRPSQQGSNAWNRGVANLEKQQKGYNAANLRNTFGV